MSKLCAGRLPAKLPLAVPVAPGCCWRRRVRRWQGQLVAAVVGASLQAVRWPVARHTTAGGGGSARAASKCGG